MASVLVPVKNVTEQIPNIAITKIDIQLYNRAFITVVYLNTQNEVIKTFNLCMEKVDYDQWLGDDNYLVEWVLNELELEKNT